MRDDTQSGTVPGHRFGGTGSGAPLSLRVGRQGLAGARPGAPRGTHIAGQLLVVFHELLILLVDGQHLADAIGGCLGLATRQRGSRSASQRREHLAHACGDKVSSHPCRSRGWKAPPKTLNSQALLTILFASPGRVPQIKRAQTEILVAELGAPEEEPKFEIQHVCWEETNPMTGIIEILSSGGGVRKSMPILGHGDPGIPKAQAFRLALPGSWRCRNSNLGVLE